MVSFTFLVLNLVIVHFFLLSPSISLFYLFRFFLLTATSVFFSTGTTFHFQFFFIPLDIDIYAYLFSSQRPSIEFLSISFFSSVSFFLILTPLIVTSHFFKYDIRFFFFLIHCYEATSIGFINIDCCLYKDFFLTSCNVFTIFYFGLFLLMNLSSCHLPGLLSQGQWHVYLNDMSFNSPFFHRITC